MLANINNEILFENNVILSENNARSYSGERKIEMPQLLIQDALLKPITNFDEIKNLVVTYDNRLFKKNVFSRMYSGL